MGSNESVEPIITMVLSFTYLKSWGDLLVFDEAFHFPMDFFTPFLLPG